MQRNNFSTGEQKGKKSSFSVPLKNYSFRIFSLSSFSLLLHYPLELRCEGYKIVSGYGLGVGSAVISGALYEIYHKQKKSLTDQLILRPFPQGDDAKEMWEIYRQDMISYSGISIFLLGNKKEGETTVLSNGMRSEYEISKKQGNFLIPIGRTGYISEVLWNELLKEKQDDHTFDIYRHDIVSLGDNTKALDEVIEIVIELIKKVK